MIQYSPQSAASVVPRPALPSTPVPPVSWETELFVVRGEDRAHLRQRIQELADFLDRHPDVVVKDLAATLNTALQPAGCRVAVVAGSAGDLQKRLARVAERLADPKCRQIRDTQGIYFFEKPLHPEGRLAFLFPGEGAQYLNMLADLLPHFPEVREHFEQCDRLSLKTGHAEPISRAIFLPPDATPEQRAQAEKHLWRLGEAVSSILIANWSIYQLLLRLGLRPDVIAGHSGGEFSALVAAGCLDHDDELVEQLFRLSNLLQQQEDEGNVTEAVLLAVGAGRKKLAEWCDLVGDGIFVAMDNCPHQTVLVGPPGPMTALEELLKTRGIVCERLPFTRPYHTPLFEPLLGPIARFYDRMGLRSWNVPLYSCMSGQVFPDDPVQVRRLAVAHWTSCVEFTSIIENMYADGVHIFIEAGPRGNLTSFLDDILRGKPVSAVAANVQRRSGITQLNHMVGQLTAHHVPVRMSHLYERRQPRAIDWEPKRSRVQEEKPEANPSAPSKTAVSVEQVASFVPKQTSADPVRGAVLAQYWNVMEQFLDLQREMMEHMLAFRARTKPASECTGHVPEPDKQRLTLPLLGDIIRHDPGREIVVRRRMDLREDLYALDHTLGGRHASALNPDLHGLPVMPMTFSMEMMAEVASLLVPGPIVIGMKRVRLQRWIQFDDEPVTLEVTARVVAGTTNQVAVAVLDLGNAVRPGNAESPTVEGTVLFGTAYPEAPVAEAFPLTNERPCGYSPEQLYEGERRLFHGPLFQAVCATERMGEEGIEGLLRTLPHSGLFRSTRTPPLLIDPLLLDASTHILGNWHLSQADQTGRVVFPYEIGSVELFGPKPPEGTRIRCRVRIEKLSARQVTHRIELIEPDDRLWARLAPAEYWRFYWPREYVDFFRFKETFLLGHDLELPASFALGKARFLRVHPSDDLRQPVKRGALAHLALSPAEWQQFRTLAEPDPRRTEWLFSRIAAKDAIRALWLDLHGERLFPADMELEGDAPGRLRARCLGSAGATQLPEVAAAFRDGSAFALAAFDPRVAEELDRLIALTPRERNTP